MVHNWTIPNLASIPLWVGTRTESTPAEAVETRPTTNSSATNQEYFLILLPPRPIYGILTASSASPNSLKPKNSYPLCLSSTLTPFQIRYPLYPQPLSPFHPPSTYHQPYRQERVSPKAVLLSSHGPSLSLDFPYPSLSLPSQAPFLLRIPTMPREPDRCQACSFSSAWNDPAATHPRPHLH